MSIAASRTNRPRVRPGGVARPLIRGAIATLAVVLVTACGGATPSATVAPTATGTSPASATGTPVATASPARTASATPSPTETSAPVPVPLVPITQFWSTDRSISRSDLALALAGAAGSPKLAVSAEDLSALAAALHVQTPVAQALAPASVCDFVRSTSGAIGVVRAEDVTMSVRALAIDGVQLFGAERTKDVSRWPLLVAETAPGKASTFGQQPIWTLAAGGDVMLDKDAYAQSILHGKGAGYPWDGGTARITGRVCCGWGGGNLVTGQRTGNTGALRSLLSSADLAIANLEAPASDAFTYHSGGFTFSVDPRMLAGVKGAGIDAVSLANNHMGNAGTQGVLDTVRYLDALGVRHTGAGANAAAARKPAILDAGGQKIAFLAYSDIQPESYFAGPAAPGTAGYSMAAIRSDITAARAAGATFVVVMPHWGIEYSDQLYDFERPDAKAMIAAGADIVIASHSHWVGSIDAIDADHVAFYSLGDFVFDWTHDERTQEGVVADLTFAGTRLVQIDLHPTVILDGGQPNLLDPATDGQVVLDQIRKTSAAHLGW